MELFDKRRTGQTRSSLVEEVVGLPRSSLVEGEGGLPWSSLVREVYHGTL